MESGSWGRTGLAGLAVLVLAVAGCREDAATLAPESARPAESATLDRQGENPEKSSHNSTLQVTDLTGALTPGDLATQLAGTGVTISNVTYSGALVSSGSFSNGTPVGLTDGMILSSGEGGNVHGPNESDATSFQTGSGSDADLNALSGFTTFDATVLEFDFVPDADSVFVEYVFGSDEYNEFVNTQFNDVFAFFVNGVNCALVGDPPEPVSINTINAGGPILGDPPISNPGLYNNNDESDLGDPSPFDTEMDGFTDVLVCRAAVTANATNHMKLAIADASDPILDSYVLLKAASFSTVPPDVIEVTIDIKPGSDPSSWSCSNGKGSIPVAVLSDGGFDATTLDANSVLFGENGDETGEVHRKGGEAKRHVEDVNGDGLDDMVFHFDFGETGFDCDDVPDGENDATLVGTLTGETQDGDPVAGSSDIRLVGAKGKGKGGS